QLTKMGIEIRSGMEQAAFHGQQVLKVDHVLLVHPVFRKREAEDRPAHDRRFEEGARDETDDGAAVVERVEVIRLRVDIDRVATVEGNVLPAIQADSRPLLQPFRMRTNEDAELA